MSSTIYLVQFRKKIVMNTDPQRRCYNGCNASEEVLWSEWDTFYPMNTLKEAEESAELFRRNHAIDSKPATREYRVLEVDI